MAYFKEEIKAGIIIFVFLIILSSFTILIGGSQFFEKLDFYYVKVMNAAGLEQGAQVKLGGVRVGRVLEIKAPDGPGEHVSIKIGLKEGSTLYKGTKALITQIGFIGDIYLLLTVDETSEDKYQIGDTIPAVEGVDFNILMSKVDVISDSLDKLIKDMDKLFSQSNLKDFEKAMKNTSTVLGEIGDLVKDTKSDISILVNKATEDLEKAGDMISAIKKTADKIGDTANAIEKTVNTVEKTTGTVEGAVDLQSQNITNLLTTMNEATEDLQEVLQEIKNKPWSIIYREGKAKNE